LLGIDFVNCGYNFGDAESSNKSIRKKRGERENVLFCIFSDEEQLEQELKRKIEKRNICKLIELPLACSLLVQVMPGFKMVCLRQLLVSETNTDRFNRWSICSWRMFVFK
jgi:hypothetical protein